MSKKIPSNSDLPDWISEHVPAELAGSTLFRFVVSLRAMNDDGSPRQILVDLLPCIDLDIENLVEQMEHLPAQYAFWAAVHSEVKLAVSVAERSLKIRRGLATKEANKQAQDIGVKLSVETIKIIVESDDELKKADMRLSIVQMHSGKLHHMLEALKMKAELARSLAGFKRQELSNN